jgi:hypothetical protein
MKAYQIFKKSVMSLIIRASMIGCGLLVAGSAFTPVTASASSAEDFDFTNNTGTTVTGLYLAAHGTNQSWGQNCLSSPMYPGETRHISWPTETGIPNWDIRLTYSTGVEARLDDGVNLSVFSRVVLHLSNNGTVSNLDYYQS